MSKINYNILNNKQSKIDNSIFNFSYLPYFIIFLLSLIVNLTYLDIVPHAVHGDVGEIALLAQKLDISNNLFKASEWWHMPSLMLLPQNLALKLEFNIQNSRLPDAIFGVIFNLCLLFFLRKTVSKNTAFLIAILATSSSQMIQSWRLGVGHAPPLLLTLLVPYIYVISINSKRWIALSIFNGLLLSLCFQTYIPSRVVIIFYILINMYFLCAFYDLRKSIFRIFCISSFVALLTALPLLMFYIEHPYTLFPRAEYSIFNKDSFAFSSQAYNSTSIVYIIALQFIRSFFSAFLFPTNASGDFYISNPGFFEGVIGLLGFIGFVTSFLRKAEIFQRVAAFGYFLCIILLSTILVNAPQYNRLLPAFVFWIILSAYALENIIKYIKKVSSKKYFNIIYILLLISVAFQFYYSLNLYFVRLNKSVWTYSGISNLSYYLNRLDTNKSDVYFFNFDTVPGYTPKYGTFRLLNPKLNIIGYDVKNNNMNIDSSKECIVLVTTDDFKIATDVANSILSKYGTGVQSHSINTNAKVGIFDIAMFGCKKSI